MSTLLNRRRFPRFVVKPMYTPVSVRALDEEGFLREGHAYDISEGGVRFELDRPLPVGTPVAMQITLPSDGFDMGTSRTILVFGTVIWLEDEEDPPPVRCAVNFTGFARVGDRDRLVQAFAACQLRAEV